MPPAVNSVAALFRTIRSPASLKSPAADDTHADIRQRDERQIVTTTDWKLPAAITFCVPKFTVELLPIPIAALPPLDPLRAGPGDRSAIARGICEGDGVSNAREGDGGGAPMTVLAVVAVAVRLPPDRDVACAICRRTVFAPGCRAE